jgi:glycosyltransferase involved in cell wall biosynthesis
MISKISIVTVNKNNAAGLEKTIKSVISQKKDFCEFIVIDGESTDNSKDLLDNYKSEISFYSSEPDTGIYNAMNKGILKSTGDFILFLNSGDFLINENVIENLVKQISSTDDIVSGSIIIEDKFNKQHKMFSQESIEIQHFINLSLYHQATLISRKLFEKFGFYNENFKIGGDYEFFIRVFYKYNCKYRRISDEISYFKSDGISNNSNYSELNKLERINAWELNVSQRTFEIFETYNKIQNSNTFWLYRKTLKSKVYHYFFQSLFVCRSRIAKFVKSIIKS